VAEASEADAVVAEAAEVDAAVAEAAEVDTNETATDKGEGQA
jgi:hypothetical protein